MEVIAYNPQKGRLETIKTNLTEDTPTWFVSSGDHESVSMVADLDNGLLISRDGRDYPVIIFRRHLWFYKMRLIHVLFLN